jgi:hypothetical protein
MDDGRWRMSRRNRAQRILRIDSALDRYRGCTSIVVDWMYCTEYRQVLVQSMDWMYNTYGVHDVLYSTVHVLYCTRSRATLLRIVPPYHVRIK